MRHSSDSSTQNSSRTCSSCGNRLSEDARYCGHCGASNADQRTDSSQRTRRGLQHDSATTADASTSARDELSLGAILLPVVTAEVDYVAKSKATAAAKVWVEDNFPQIGTECRSVPESRSVQELVSAYGFPTLGSLSVQTPDDESREGLKSAVRVIDRKGGFDTPGSERTPFGKSIAVNVIDENGRPYTSADEVLEDLTAPDTWVYNLVVIR
jgi:hypothetical protein